MNPQMNETLEAFVSHLYIKASPQTVAAYQYDVAKFMEYLTDIKIKRIASIKTDHITIYLGRCKKGGKSDSSIKRYYHSIYAFCRFLRQRKLLAIDLSEVPKPRAKIVAPRIPSMEEIALLLEKPNVATEAGLRDRAILELLYSSGLRASELCDLQLEDFAEGIIHVKCGKGNKARSVPLTDEAQHWINRYITERRGLEEGPLFCTLLGKPIQRRLLCTIVTEYAAKAGLQGVTPHTLRHTCATHLLDHGADLRMIQEVLGHTSITSTQRYTHLSKHKVQLMFKQFHPRAGNVQDALNI